MGEIILYSFYIFLFYWVLKKKVEFIYFIPFFGVGMDMSFNFFSGFSVPAYVRGVIFLLFFIYARRYFTVNRLFLPFYAFIGWMLFLLLQSGEFMYSFKAVIQVIFSMLVFIVAYNYFNTAEKLNRLFNSLYWILLIAILATAAGYLFGLGQSFDYLSKYDTEEDVIGLLGSSGLYSPGMVIALLPLLLKLVKKPWIRVTLPLASIILYIFMILTMRRTVMLIPVVGILGYFLYSRRRLKFIRYLGIAAAILLLTLPFYESILLKRYETRKNSGRFEEDFYKTEQRYLENVYMLEKINSFDDPANIVFGIGNNIFAENIQQGKITGRMFHTDFAKLFYSVGLFGIFVYLALYITLFNRIRKIPTTARYADFKAAAMGIFLISVFVSFNGSVTIITFRAMFFLLLGAILGYVRRARLLETKAPATGYSINFNKHEIYNQ